MFLESRASAVFLLFFSFRFPSLLTLEVVFLPFAHSDTDGLGTGWCVARWGFFPYASLLMRSEANRLLMALLQSCKNVTSKDQVSGGRR